MLWACLKGNILISPGRRIGKRLLVAIERCSPHFNIRPQAILLRLTNRRLYVGTHVHQHLTGLDTEWEERLTQWTLGIQNALEEGVGLPLFPVEVAASQRGTGLVLQSD